MFRLVAVILLPGAAAVTGSAHARVLDEALETGAERLRADVDSAEETHHYEALAEAAVKAKLLQSVLHLAAARAGLPEALARAPRLILEAHQAAGPTALAEQEYMEHLMAPADAPEEYEDPEFEEGDYPVHLSHGTREALVEMMRANASECLFCDHDEDEAAADEQGDDAGALDLHARAAPSALEQLAQGSFAGQSLDTTLGGKDSGEGQNNGFQFDEDYKAPAPAPKGPSREDKLMKSIYGRKDGGIPANDEEWKAHDASVVFHRRRSDQGGKEGQPGEDGGFVMLRDDQKIDFLEKNEDKLQVHFTDKMINRLVNGDYWILLADMANRVTHAKKVTSQVDPDLFIRMCSVMMSVLTNYTDAADDFGNVLVDADDDSDKRHVNHERRTLKMGREAEAAGSNDLLPMFDEVGAMHRKNKQLLKAEKESYEIMLQKQIEGFMEYADGVSQGLKDTLDKTKRTWAKTKKAVSKKKTAALRYMGAQTKVTRALENALDKSGALIMTERNNFFKMRDKVWVKSRKRMQKITDRTEKALDRERKTGEKARAEEWKKVEDGFELAGTDQEKLETTIRRDFERDLTNLEKPYKYMTKESEMDAELMRESENEMIDQKHKMGLEYAGLDDKLAGAKETIETNKKKEKLAIDEMQTTFLDEAKKQMLTLTEELKNAREDATFKLKGDMRTNKLAADANLNKIGTTWDAELKKTTDEILTGQELMSEVGEEIGAPIVWPAPPGEDEEGFQAQRADYDSRSTTTNQAAAASNSAAIAGAHGSLAELLGRPILEGDNLPSKIKEAHDDFIGDGSSISLVTSFLPKMRIALDEDKIHRADSIYNRVKSLLDENLETKVDSKWADVKAARLAVQEEKRLAQSQLYELQKEALNGPKGIPDLAKAKLRQIWRDTSSMAKATGPLASESSAIETELAALGNDIENIIRPNDGRVALAKGRIKSQAAGADDQLETLKSSTWKKLGEMVTRTTDVLKAVETSFVGSDQVDSSVKGQIYTVKAALRADAAQIKAAADAAFKRLNEPTYTDAITGTDNAGVSYANRAALSDESNNMEMVEEKAQNTYGTWQSGFTDPTIATIHSKGVEADQNNQAIFERMNERIGAAQRAGASGVAAARAQLPKSVAGADRAAQEENEATKTAAVSKLADDLDDIGANNDKQRLRLDHITSDTDDKISRLANIRKSAQGKFASIQYDASQLIDGMWAKLSEEAEHLSLDAVQQEKTEQAQEAALNKRAEYMNNLLFRESGTTHAAMTAEMQNAVTKSHETMKQINRNNAMTDTQQWSAIDAEDRRLKQELSSIAARTGAANDAVSAFVADAYQDSMDVAGESTSADAAVEGNAMGEHQAMDAAAKVELRELAGGTSAAESLVQVLTHMKSALTELQDSMGQTFKHRQEAALEHIAHGHYASEALAGSVKDDVQHLLDSQYTMVDQIKEGSQRIAHEYYQRRDASKNQLGVVSGLLADETSELAKDAGVLQARVEHGVHDVTDTIASLLPTVDGVVTSAEEAEAERAKTHGEFERGLIEAENLEAEHNQEEVLALRDEVQKESLTADRRQLWKHHFGMTQHAWKQVVADKLKELGYALDQESLDAMASIHAHHVAAEENAKFGAAAADEADAIERHTQAEVLRLHEEADREIDAILADASLSKAEKDRRIAEIRARTQRDASAVFQNQTETVLRQEKLTKALAEYHQMVDAAKEATAEAIAAGHLSPEAVDIHKQLASLANNIAELHSQPWLQSALQVGQGANTKVAAANAELTRSNAGIASEIHALEAALAKRRAAA